MSYFVRTNNDLFQVWKIEGSTAVLCGVTNPENGSGTYFKAGPNETIWDAIKRGTDWFGPSGETPFVQTELEPGEYYPRMARLGGFIGEREWCPDKVGHLSTIALARVQLSTLTQQLGRICQTVHPSPETLDVFGHDIRNLLILACTEVENHWRGVLGANGVKKDRYDTRDYVLLRKAMKLDEYSVAFPKYPWLDAISPFAGWGDSGRPTQDLKWYDAYNAVKHARETNFSRGALRHVFEALSGCAIMVAAQFDMERELEMGAEFESFFRFTATPAWERSELYLAPRLGSTTDWRPRNYDFSRT